MLEFIFYKILHIYPTLYRLSLLLQDDTVKITRGTNKGRDGKIIGCYRKKWSIQIENVTKDKANGGSVNIPFHPSNVKVVSLKLDNDRKNLLARKSSNTSAPKMTSMTSVE